MKTRMKDRSAKNGLTGLLQEPVRLKEPFHSEHSNAEGKASSDIAS
jgi:hypothetical protein